MHLILKTKRLNLRPISLKDADFIVELVNSEGWLKFIGERNVRSKSDAELYVQKILDKENFFYNVFELNDSNKAIGIISFILRDNQQYPDLGFAILPEFERRGYTYEAATNYLDKLIAEGTNKVILGITNPENAKSINLLQRLGFHFSKQLVEETETLSLFELHT